MTCSRCKRELLDATALAAQADAVRAVVAGSLSLAQGGSKLEAAYGGLYGVRRALEAQLPKRKGARDHAGAAAWLAGTCILPVAIDRASRDDAGRPES